MLLARLSCVSRIDNVLGINSSVAEPIRKIHTRKWVVFYVYCLKYFCKRFRKSLERRLLPLSCLSFSPSVYLPAYISAVPTGWVSVKFWDFYKNMSRNSKIRLQSNINIGNFTWISKNICTLDVSMKYFVAQKSAKANHCLITMATLNNCILLTGTCGL